MKKNNIMDIFLDILTILTSSIFNMVVFLASFIIIFTVASKSFDYGRDIVKSELSEKPSNVIELNIPTGATQVEIAKLLKDNKIIANEQVFLLQSRLNGTYNLFKSGTYTLNTNMKTAEIMDELQKVQSTVDDIKVTIPEGLTLNQIGELLESKELFTKQEFLDACNSDVFLYSFLENANNRDKKLEGYLFPDTYYFAESSSPKDVIIKMLDRFEEIYSTEFINRTEELGLTIDQVVIMASIIEEEIVQPTERKLASSVIYNRLEKEMPLQMCSTILYALEKRKDRLLDKDLKVDSPYNTYITGGLPIGPICNPGEASINAVLYPEETNYLYFVLTDDKTGVHFFTDSYDDFVSAKEQYNQKY